MSGVLVDREALEEYLRLSQGGYSYAALKQAAEPLRAALALPAQAAADAAEQPQDVLRNTPAGAALTDAYLTLRGELNTLISYAQQAEIGKGLSVQALREHAESLIPLLDEPQGRQWTSQYWDARHALEQTLAPLEKYLADLTRGKRRDYLIEDLVTKLRRAKDLTVDRSPVPVDVDADVRHFALEAGEGVTLPAGRLRLTSTQDGVGAFQFTPEVHG